MIDRDPEALIEDIEWMLGSGEHPDRVTVRAGWNHRRSLARWLRRHGRDDLANTVDVRTEAAA